MGLAVALSLALITQPGTTQILQVDGSVKQFQLYWDFEGELILELNGATVTQINGAAPTKPVSITFKPLQLNLAPAVQVSNPYRCTLANPNGAAVLTYQFGSVNYGTDPTTSKQSAALGFTFGGFVSDLMSPYSFIAFDYGASESLTLYPESNDAQDIEDVMRGNSFSVGGSAVFTQAVTPNNTMLYPRHWRPIKVIP